MRKAIAGLLLILAAEGTALACSCLRPGTPEQSRSHAREAVKRAVAIVQAEVLSEYRPGGPGERVRVDKVLWGESPAELRIARGEFASGASCDLLLGAGQRKVLILYDPGDAPHRLDDRRAPAGSYAIQSSCSDYLVSEDEFLAVTLDEARRREALPVTGERG
ncbi:hypothetical protein E2493_04090 [Sphingomonas parva]|uniref:Lipoprotein n=1 Tax=Sphingomonas parva TaxID=2555898 RepID=A0A4Y8ZXY8_9SPHN|nr:hypothetical protein [Sphingomonas parva]TFI59386.1 hypothetical protein E2493_04090 [Sphingomonas parva]